MSKSNTSLLSDEFSSTWKNEDVPILQCPCDPIQPSLPFVQYPAESDAVRIRELMMGPSNDVISQDKKTKDLQEQDFQHQEYLSSGEVSLSGDIQNVVLTQSHSLSERTCCRICQDDDTNEKLISPCYCTGSVGFMHFSCLEKWLQTNCRSHCELCLLPFPVERVPPTICTFLRHPRQNMDMSSFLCDVSCFCVLTPLLIASTYLCSIGVTYYQAAGKPESVFAVATLIMSLVTVYFAWATLAFLYHRRVWLTWREKNSQIRMFMDTEQMQHPLNRLDKTCLESDSTASDSCRVASQQDSTSVLFRPITLLTKGKLPNVHNLV